MGFNEVRQVLDTYYTARIESDLNKYISWLNPDKFIHLQIFKRVGSYEKEYNGVLKTIYNEELIHEIKSLGQ